MDGPPSESYRGRKFRDDWECLVLWKDLFDNCIPLLRLIHAQVYGVLVRRGYKTSFGVLGVLLRQPRWILLQWGNNSLGYTVFSCMLIYCECMFMCGSSEQQQAHKET